MNYSTVSFSEKGKREQNEDCLYPSSTLPNATNVGLFIVCDGVGGAYGGEEASAVVCEYLSQKIIALLPYWSVNPDYPKESLSDLLDMALRQTEIALDTVSQNSGMATTLTVLLFTEHGAFAAWVGDSRIYLFRKGKIHFESEDHSLVYGLYKKGLIEKHELETHPKRNIILRAITGTEEHAESDSVLFQHLHENDVFLLCTDGVMESINDELLLEIVSQNDIEAAAEEIKKICAEKSKDNYSGYLIKIHKTQ